MMMTAIPWWTKTGPLWYPHPTGRTSGATAWAQGKKLARFSHRTWLLQTRDKPVQESRSKNHVREETTETRPKHPHTIPRQSERSQHRTCHWSRAEKTHSLLPLPTTWAYGGRVSEPSTEGHSPIFSQEFLFAKQLGHMAGECQNPAPKDTPQSPAKNFFLPEDAFAQLHNLSSYMLFDGASKTFLGCNSDPKHPGFIGLILGPARGLTDTGAQQPVVGSSAALRWCDRLLKRHGLVPVDVTATCGGIGTAQVVQVLDVPAGIVGVNGVMRFLVLEEPRNDPHGEVGQRAIWTYAQPAGLLFERRLETARQLARPAQA